MDSEWAGTKQSTLRAGLGWFSSVSSTYDQAMWEGRTGYFGFIEGSRCPLTDIALCLSWRQIDVPNQCSADLSDNINKALSFSPCLICSCASIPKSQEFLSFKTFIYLFGVVLEASSKAEVLFVRADLNTGKRKQPSNISETMTKYI